MSSQVKYIVDAMHLELLTDCENTSILSLVNLIPGALQHTGEWFLKELLCVCVSHSCVGREAFLHMYMCFCMHMHFCVYVGGHVRMTYVHMWFG